MKTPQRRLKRSMSPGYRNRGDWIARGKATPSAWSMGSDGEEETYEEEPLLISDRGKGRSSWNKSRTGSRALVRDTVFCIPSSWFSCCLGRSGSSALDYESFLTQVKTGDIFLFEGKGGFSCVIQCLSSARYSHIAVAVKLVDPNRPTSPHFMLWESTTSDQTYDFVTGTDKNGLRLVSMHEKLYEYAQKNYSISYRPLTVYDEAVSQKIKEGQAALRGWELILRGAHIPYETDYIELANAHKRWVVGERGHAGEHNRGSVFCSEAVMWFYRDAMGLSLNDEESGQTWTPEDFTPEDFAAESEGIPFVYSDPPRAEFGGQYMVASRKSVDEGLVARYEEFTATRKQVGDAFRKMVDSAVAVEGPRRGPHQESTTHVDGEKLWRMDFGQNEFPHRDATTGMEKISLNLYG